MAYYFRDIADLDKECNSTMQPGDFFIYRPENLDDKIIISYVRPFRVAENKPHGLENTPKNSFININVRRADFDKHMGSDFEKLAKYVDKGLKYIVGWDFDLTLTAYHAWPNAEIIPPEITLENNLRFPDHTKKVLASIANNEKYIQIISTKNLQTRVENYLKAWFDNDNIFKAIFDRTAHYRKRDNDNDKVYTKEFHFLNAFINSTKIKDVDNEGYLDLSKENPVIDIVKCYLIDDTEKDFAAYHQCGITTIKVEELSNKHLLEVVSTLNLKLYHNGNPIQLPLVNKTKKSELNAPFGFFTRRVTEDETQVIHSTNTIMVEESLSVEEFVLGLKENVSNHHFWSKQGVRIPFLMTKTPSTIIELEKAVTKIKKGESSNEDFIAAAKLAEKYLRDAINSPSFFRKRPTNDFYRDELKKCSKLTELGNH